MSGIAGIIHWDGAPVAAEDLQRMIRLMEHRGPDGIQQEIDGPVGFAHARMALRREELQWRTQPVWLPDRSKAIVSDARLYNRGDLLSRLGAVEWFRDLVSDAEIILALFERHGEATPNLLDGDFAFVIWDARSRKIFAARDPFGVKPLVYWAQGNHFVFASEPKQILSLPYVPLKPDDMAVGEVLVNRYQDSGRTFYQDVHLVRPAHYLVISGGERREARHWNPDPQRVHSFAKPDDCFEQFREHLKQAVAKRLQVDCPVVADLSGGYDSSAIVAMAAAAQREGLITCPRLETLSALYPGLPCDEREYSEAVSEVVPFPRRTYVGCEIERCIGAAEELRRVDGPYLQPPDGESLALAENLRDAGARIVLTGVCGDELAYDGPILYDLAASGSYLRLTRLLWATESVRRDFLRRYPRALLRFATPAWARRSYRVVRPRSRWRAPNWMCPVFASRLEGYFATNTAPTPKFPSRLQQWVHDALTGARAGRVLELIERRRAYMGVELRHPFADRPLVEFVLGIGFRERIPDSGHRRYLFRRALCSDLPPKVRDRLSKGNFNQLHERGYQEMLNRIKASEDWSSGAYVDERTGRLLLKAVQDGETSRWSLPNMMGVMSLERWLKTLDERGPASGRR